MTSQTSQKTKREKPEKPYPDFPLFAHASGQWAKTILGRHVYFGKWDDWQAALDKYNREKDYLHLGQAPPANHKTLADVLNSYMGHKRTRLQIGKLTPRTFAEYESVCDIIASTLGKQRPYPSIAQTDLERLAVKLCHTPKGKLRSVQRQDITLSMARSVFLYAAEVLDLQLQYKRALRGPSAKDVRKAKAQTGEQMLSAKQINALIDDAGPQLKAMIYLGINCGFGNEDCATLTLDNIDLSTGWHNHPRPKTGVARRCKLWKETVAALKAAIKSRPVAKKPEHENLVFITRCGNPWSYNGGESGAISYEFGKLTRKLKMHRKYITTFYSLRRTFETVGATANRQNALDYAMGHIPEASDMSAVYRQKIYDKPLLELTQHVRKWLRGSITLV